MPERKENLEFVTIKLSWSKNHKFGHEFDLDLSCFLLNATGKITEEKDFVFYNNSISPCGAAKHNGDNRQGEEGVDDSETIDLDFPKLGQTTRIPVAVSIHDSSERRQIFGIINNARLEISNRKNGEIIAEWDLSESFTQETAVVVGEFFLDGTEWKFHKIDTCHFKNLVDLACHYGINKNDCD